MTIIVTGAAGHRRHARVQVAVQAVEAVAHGEAENVGAGIRDEPGRAVVEVLSARNQAAQSVAAAQAGECTEHQQGDADAADGGCRHGSIPVLVAVMGCRSGG